HATGKLPAKKDVVRLITQPSSALLVAHDVFGHQYSVDLLKDARTAIAGSSAKVLRQGPVAVQMRTYDTMMPNTTQLGAPNGALPHFFGVHAYLTAWANQDALSLDIRVNNGPSGRDGNSVADDPLGQVYFKDIELWIPNGWTALSDVGDPA